ASYLEKHGPTHSPAQAAAQLQASPPHLAWERISAPEPVLFGQQVGALTAQPSGVSLKGRRHFAGRRSSSMSKGQDIRIPSLSARAPYFIGWFMGRYAY